MSKDKVTPMTPDDGTFYDDVYFYTWTQHMPEFSFQAIEDTLGEWMLVSTPKEEIY